MTGYETTESGLSFLLKTIAAYGGGGVFLYAAFVMLIPASVFGGRRVRAVFLWPLLILAVTAFNPYVFPWLFIHYQQLIEEYYKFLWVVPVLLMIACGAVLIAFRFRSKLVKFLVFLAFCALLALGAVPRITEYVNYSLPGNAMKADAELLTLCDYILENAPTDTPLVAFERLDFAQEAAAYNASIRISDLLIPPESGEAEITRSNGEDFIVIGKDSAALPARLKELGYRACAETPESLVFVPRPKQ